MFQISILVLNKTLSNSESEDLDTTWWNKFVVKTYNWQHIRRRFQKCNTVQKYYESIKNMHKKRKITGNCIWKSTDFLAVAFQKKSLNLAKFQPTYSKTKNKVITWDFLMFYQIFLSPQKNKHMRQTLVLVWNKALQEKFNFNFWTVFRLYWQNFHFGRKTRH